MFPTTTRLLTHNTSRFTCVMLLMSMVVLLGWGLWFVFAPISVYEVTDVAHLEKNSQSADKFRIVANFLPSPTLWHIRIGQIALIRFTDFPWMRYGTVTASVEDVAQQVVDGRVRVNLLLDTTSNQAVEYKSGLTATVEIEIEQVSPATLVLRSIGQPAAIDSRAN